MLAVGGAYVAARRGTEPQRARPSRCEAAPPKPERRKASCGGFLKWRGTASFCSRSRRGLPTRLRRADRAVYRRCGSVDAFAADQRLGAHTASPASTALRTGHGCTPRGRSAGADVPPQARSRHLPRDRLDVGADLAAVDLVDGAGDVGGLLGGEEGDQVAELVGSPRRPSGIVAASGASCSSAGSRASGSALAAPGWMREVRNIPGSTRLIVMPSLARSGIIAFISPAMPGRIPFERSRTATGSFTELDWMATMRPQRARAYGAGPPARSARS